MGRGDGMGGYVPWVGAGVVVVIADRGGRRG